VSGTFFSHVGNEETGFGGLGFRGGCAIRFGEHGAESKEEEKKVPDAFFLQTFSAVWDTNPTENGEVYVAGAPGTGLAGYTATVNGNCGGTCLASAFLNDTNSLGGYAAVSSSLTAPGSGYVRNPGLDAINPWHWRSVSFRGYGPAQQEGLPSTHVPVPTKLRLDANGIPRDVRFHVDARYPYEDLVGMGIHLGSMARSIWSSIVRLFGG
jgi:hypothetical protein